jgi:NADPH-dependent 2,4-dienoyl-CoA reductase/sulfur reductase-like enzyme
MRISCLRSSFRAKLEKIGRKIDHFDRIKFFPGSYERHFSSHKQLPTHANVIVVGGGIIGNSVAYHLGKLGVENVILLEQDQVSFDE